MEDKSYGFFDRDYHDGFMRHMDREHAKAALASHTYRQLLILLKGVMYGLIGVAAMVASLKM